MKKHKTLLNWCGLLGVVSLLSYTAAVLFAPLAYPGYNWMSQAVSDLSAANAPSLRLWNQLSCLYGVCGLLSCMMLCVWIQGRATKLIHVGIYLFTGMNWLSYVGFSMFPLSDSGYAGTFQDVMHMVVTAGVVILSIASLVTIIVGGVKEQSAKGLAGWAALALFMMLLGAVLSGVVPLAYFGVVERFSVFAAAGFTAVLGIYLFLEKFNN